MRAERNVIGKVALSQPPPSHAGTRRRNLRLLAFSAPPESPPRPSWFCAYVPTEASAPGCFSQTYSCYQYNDSSLSTPRHRWVRLDRHEQKSVSIKKPTLESFFFWPLFIYDAESTVSEEYGRADQVGLAASTSLCCNAAAASAGSHSAAFDVVACLGDA